MSVDDNPVQATVDFSVFPLSLLFCNERYTYNKDLLNHKRYKAVVVVVRDELASSIRRAGSGFHARAVPMTMRLRKLTDGSSRMYDNTTARSSLHIVIQSSSMFPTSLQTMSAATPRAAQTPDVCGPAART